MVSNICPPCGTFLSTFGWGVTDGANTFEVCTSNCRDGLLGSGTGQFFDPSGVAVDASGNVLVVDADNFRVQKFTNGESFLSMFGWGMQDGAGVFETCTSGVREGGCGRRGWAVLGRSVEGRRGCERERLRR